MQRTLLDDDHIAFGDLIRTFIDREIRPYREQWLRDGQVTAGLWRAAGAAGLLGINVAEEFGGSGLNDFRFNAVLVEELCRANMLGLASGFGIHATIVAAYLTELSTTEQARRWLPRFASGHSVAALAMTEPEAGSDVKALRTRADRVAGGWVLNGQKTFITNGILSNILVVACKTDPDAGHRGISLFVVTDDMPGFSRGRRLSKVGQHDSDTAELYFSDVLLGEENLIGELNRGFYHMMERLPRERLSIAVMAVASAEATYEAVLEYARTRKLFGGSLGDLQATRFTLAEMATELDIARTFVDRCIESHNNGELSAVDAAKAKWWTTELQNRISDAGVQLFGGYGYMTEYPVAQSWLDGRVQTIYGGTTQVMKDLIGRAIMAETPGR